MTVLPLPPPLPSTHVATSADPPTRRHRSWAQRLLITLNATLAVAAVATAGWAVYVYDRVSDLPSIDVDDVLGARPSASSDRTEDTRPPPGDPENFLVVGSDSRQFVAETGEAESFGSAEEYTDARADTILLVRVDPKTRTGALLSFPRDLVVDISGGGRGRINTAFQPGGPEGAARLIATVRGNFDVPVDHYVQVDFAGFRQLVDAIDGVKVYFPAPARDWGPPEPGARFRNLTGLDITSAGCQELGGEQALAYVRSRNFEQLVDGEWERDITGDFGRIRRQQDFITRAVRKAVEEGLVNPLTMNRLLNAAEGHLVLDDNISPNDLIDLGTQFDSISPASLQRLQLPVAEVNPGGTYRGEEIVDEAEAERIFNVFRGLPLEAVATSGPASVAVDIYNGTGRRGEAGVAAYNLGAEGFVARAAGDRPASPTARTTIEYAPGREEAARLLASYFPVEPLLVADPSLGNALTLVTGADFTGEVEAPRAADATTATTAPATTTTTITEEERTARSRSGVAEQDCYGEAPEG